MVILHIAAINDNPCAGVPVAVPQHLIAQRDFADVALLNIRPYKIKNIEKCFIYKKGFSIDELPDEFTHPDLVVFHEIYYIEFVKLSRSLSKKGIPYIIIPHGSLTNEAQRKKRIKKLVGNMMLFNSYINNARAIQFLSDVEMENSNIGKRRFVEPNGIFMPQSRCRQALNEDKTINLVYIGDLSIQIKGLDLMLGAIKAKERILKENGVEVYIYGPDYGTRHKDLMKIISELELQDLVHLHDAVVGDEKKDILLSANGFIQTSRSEGMSMGILEALSYGIPCVVTQGTNLKEIIEENNAGWGASNTVESISDAIQQFVTEKEKWNAKSINAIKLIEKEYSWSVVAQRTVKAYEDLL